MCFEFDNACIIFSLVIMFGAMLILQIIYYSIFYLRILWIKPAGVRDDKKNPVSVVICAKNEAPNLEQYLPAILTQNYPDYEVIVVNDCSEDNTEELLNKFKKQYKNLYVTNIKKDLQFSHGKKLALTVGIKAAKHEWILFTDADCLVASPNWISEMEKNFTPKTEIVIGYGGYFKTKGLLNKIIRYDTLFIAMQYITFALSKIPYMGVGRNMAYRKSLFFKSKGFASHNFLLSGSDDLFVNRNATRKNLKVEISPESFTHSVPKKSCKTWYWQKVRHISTAKYYKLWHKLLLFLEPSSRILLYALFILLLCFQQFTIYIVAGFLIRTILYYIVIAETAKRFNGKDLIFFGIIFDIFLPIINFIISFSRIFRPRNNSWK